MPAPTYSTEVGRALGKIGGSHLTISTDRGNVYDGILEMRINIIKYIGLGSVLILAALYCLYRNDVSLAVLLTMIGAYYFGRYKEENHWFDYVKTKPALVGG